MSATDPKAAAPTAEDVEQAVSVIEALLVERIRVFDLEEPLRKRLMMAAGRLAGPSREERKAVARARRKRKRDAKVAEDTALLDQTGRTVTPDSLKGTFWLVAFMTTDTVTTPHLTPLTQQLLWANWRYRDEPDVGLLCLTLDATHDTPAQLRQYVAQNERYNRYPDKWRFLTGDQASIDTINPAMSPRK